MSDFFRFKKSLRERLTGAFVQFAQIIKINKSYDFINLGGISDVRTDR